MMWWVLLLVAESSFLVFCQIPGGSKTTLGAGVKQLPGGGGIFKSAAVAVLRLERKLMSTGDITRVALERGLIKCQGKTPEATMASALYTDVKRKERKSIFTRYADLQFGPFKLLLLPGVFENLKRCSAVPLSCQLPCQLRRYLLLSLQATGGALRSPGVGG